jgi:hypothetical protein
MPIHPRRTLTESTADPQVKKYQHFTGLEIPGPDELQSSVGVCPISMWNILPVEQSIIIVLIDGTIQSFLIYTNFCMRRLTTIVKHQPHLISPREIGTRFQTSALTQSHNGF